MLEKIDLGTFDLALVHLRVMRRKSLLKTPLSRRLSQVIHGEMAQLEALGRREKVVSVE